MTELKFNSSVCVSQHNYDPDKSNASKTKGFVTPSAKQERSMAWQAIVNGANGIFFFA